MSAAASSSEQALLPKPSPTAVTTSADDLADLPVSRCRAVTWTGRRVAARGERWAARTPGGYAFLRSRARNAGSRPLGRSCLPPRQRARASAHGTWQCCRRSRFARPPPRLPRAALPLTRPRAPHTQSVAGLRVVFLGAGYVGGPTAAVLASKNAPDGVSVTVLDLSEARIAAWSAALAGKGRPPILEAGLPEQLALAGAALAFATPTDAVIAAADVIFVCVNTPTKTSGEGAGSACDTTWVQLAARSIAAARVAAKAARPCVVVEKSTVPVRTAEAIAAILDANCPPPCGACTVVSSPETLAEGTAIADLLAPSRVIIGGGRDAASRAAVGTLAALYHARGRWVPREKILTTSVWSSELSKLAANAFLAQRVSSINALSAVCEATGADVGEIAKVVGADPRVGPKFLNASLGFGGSCFKKDLMSLCYLASSLGLPDVAAYWGQVIKMNEAQTARFGRAVVDACFGSVRGKRIALLGFAFKSGSSDTRESPAAYLARDLLAEGAVLAVYDPAVGRPAVLAELHLTCGVDVGDAGAGAGGRVLEAASAADACAGAHAVLVCTEWPQFAALDWRALAAACAKPAAAFDGRPGVVDAAVLRGAGFDSVHVIGRPPWRRPRSNGATA